MSRLKPDDRKLQILRAALIVASKDGGLSTISRQAVAAEMKKSDLYREWARVLDMCEGTKVNPGRCCASMMA